MNKTATASFIGMVLLVMGLISITMVSDLNPAFLFEPAGKFINSIFMPNPEGYVLRSVFLIITGFLIMERDTVF